MARRNKTKFAILGILSLEPKSGYEIRKFVKSSIGYFWHESYGQIYPVLREMEAGGLLESQSERHEKGSDKIVYTLTETGRKELKDWLGKPVEIQPYRNELLLKLFFGREISNEENLAHLDRAEKSALQLLKTYEKISGEEKKKLSENPNLPYWMFTLDFGMEAIRSELKWISNTRKELMKNRI